jgi:hypothetical protein
MLKLEKKAYRDFGKDDAEITRQGETMETKQTEGGQRSSVYPKHVGAFYVCARALRGKHSFDPSEAEKLVSVLLDRDEFRLLRFSYRESVRGPSSPAMREFFNFMSEHGYSRRYKPWVVTEEGIQYCRDVVNEFVEDDAEGAAALASVFDFHLEDLDKL